MIGRLFVAGAIGVLVFLICVLLGPLLGDLKIEILATIGDWLTKYAVVFGVIAAVLAFFSGWNPFQRAV